MFEGPGKGGVMRMQGMHFTHEWEKPVKAFLDYFKLEDVAEEKTVKVVVLIN